MKTWKQRAARTPFGPSPSKQYHGCLDALIATIRHLEETAKYHVANEWDRTMLTTNIKYAKKRAAICAGLLFDRWIEEVETPPLHIDVETLEARMTTTVPEWSGVDLAKPFDTSRYTKEKEANFFNRYAYHGSLQDWMAQARFVDARITVGKLREAIRIRNGRVQIANDYAILRMGIA